MQEIISIKTQGRSTIDITNEVEKLVNRSGIDSGLCNLFILTKKIIFHYI